MLATLERIFKRILSRILRVVVGSTPISIAPGSQFRRILVVRQHNQLGDMLCAVPMLRALRSAFPSAYIALMASPLNYDVMRNNKYVDDVMKYDKSEFLGRGLNGLGNLRKFISVLRLGKFELAVVPSTVSTSFTSGLLARLSGARTRIGAASLNGAENPSSFFFNVPIELDWRATPHRHQTLRNLDILQPLGCSTGDVSVEVTLTDDERKQANQLRQKKIEEKKLIICYHPGAGKIPNRWNASRFAQAANTLAREFSATTFITAGPMDDEPVRQMIPLLTVPHRLITRKTIREVAVVLSTVDLVITNDTGIMHAAAAVGAPTLSLFGSTEPEQWAPQGKLHRSIQGVQGDVNAISVEQVLHLAREMLVHG